MTANAVYNAEPLPSGFKAVIRCENLFHVTLRMPSRSEVLIQNNLHVIVEDGRVVEMRRGGVTERRTEGTRNAH